MNCVLAIDIGGTKLAAALVDEAGSILRSATRPTPRTEVMSALAALIAEVTDGGPPPQAVGIGCAGPLDLASGTVSPVNMPSWRGFPLREEVRKLTGLPTMLAGDAQCFALGEHWLGAGRGCTSLLGVVVSTGIGGGLVIDGAPLLGPTGNAGHVGHMSIDPYGERCECGGRGCVEHYASGPNMVRWALENGWSPTTTPPDQDTTDDHIGVPAGAGSGGATLTDGSKAHAAVRVADPAGVEPGGQPADGARQATVARSDDAASGVTSGATSGATSGPAGAGTVLRDGDGHGHVGGDPGAGAIGEVTAPSREAAGLRVHDGAGSGGDAVAGSRTGMVNRVQGMADVGHGGGGIPAHEQADVGRTGEKGNADRTDARTAAVRTGANVNVVRTDGKADADRIDDDADAVRTGVKADARALARDAAAGHPVAMAAFERGARALAAMVASTAAVAEVTTVVIGGGVSAAGAVLFDPLERALDDVAGLAFVRAVQVKQSTLVGRAGLAGAANLAWQAVRSTA
ncbi:ROK family protein [Nonomuraea sp. NPDC049709]|uniref:ROK family protein n=1 Tax=Nonomuraea sp. NPDC049709 TaxID=3154736 RepID=UPI00341265BE